jgi:hypothetical protein
MCGKNRGPFDEAFSRGYEAQVTVMGRMVVLSLGCTSSFDFVNTFIRAYVRLSSSVQAMAVMHVSGQ